MDNLSHRSKSSSASQDKLKPVTGVQHDIANTMSAQNFTPAPTDPSLSLSSAAIMTPSTAAGDADASLDQRTTRRSIRSREQPQTQTARKLPASTSTPKTALEKVMFRRNANKSPLLRLPSELRNRIWGLVLGERVVHIRKAPFTVPLSWNHNILQGRECGCTFTETGNFQNYMACLKALGELEMNMEPEKEEKSSAGELFNLDFSTLENPDVLGTFDFDSFLNQADSDDFDVDFDSFLNQADANDSRGAAFPDYARIDHDGETPYECFTLPDGLPGLATLEPKQRKIVLLDALQSNPHAACKGMLPGTQSRRSRPRLSLNLLRASRQIYGEAKAVFWSSNTFSFSAPTDFVRFFKAPSRTTRAQITKLHLDLVPGGIHDAWMGAIRKKGLVSTLRGLKELHIHVTDEFFNGRSYSSNFFTHAFAPFCGLMLKDATVVVADVKKFGEYTEIIERVRKSLMGQGPVGTF